MTMEIPDFLRRTPDPQRAALQQQNFRHAIGEPPVTTPTPAPAKKTRRQDALIARVTISIPLDMADAESLGRAINAVAKIKDGLPAGAVVEVESRLGKL